MLVLCTGMARSGSTWSFNVAKQLLRRVSGSVRAGYADTVGEALRVHGQTAEHVVVKCHDPDDVGRALIKQGLCRTIYTYREPLDAVLSAVEAFERPFEGAVAVTQASLALMRFQVEAGGVLCLWYGDVVGRSREAVAAVADYLGLALPADAITEVADELSRDNVRRLIKAQGKSATQAVRPDASWDTGTLFSDRHLRDHPSDPATVFSAAQIAAVVDRLGDVVDAAGVLREPIRELGYVGRDRDQIQGWPRLVALDDVVVAAELAEVDGDPSPADEPADAAPPAAPPEIAQPPAVVAQEPAPPKAPTAPPSEAPAKPQGTSFDPRREARARALARDLIGAVERERAERTRRPRPGR